jgi:spoIIIJ-associated protein
MDKDQSIEFAKKYLSDILSFFGVNTDIEVFIEEDIIHLEVPPIDESSILIGRHADTLQSIQMIVSSALRSNNVEYNRVNIDIAGYKKQRAEKVAERAKEWIEEVRKTGDSRVANLNAADRRIVHNVASEYSDIRTFSEGEGRDRRIVIAQASS